MQKVSSYKLTTSGQAREKLREKGQFWTPNWVAEAMVAYVLADKSNTLFDPAVGTGVFFRAAKTMADEKKFSVSLSGMDIDSNVLKEAFQNTLSKEDLSGVTIGDFVFQFPQVKLPAIVANPPYIRHHRLSIEVKEKLKRLSLQTIGKILDGRAGLHIYFLIRALTLLDNNGRLAFIMPADTCEGKFSKDLWRWIAANFLLEAVITFAPEASPFPNVDTNPLIFFIRKAEPKEKILWVKCCEPQTEMLKIWVESGFIHTPKEKLFVIQRELSEALYTGLSRQPITEKISKYVLGDFVQIVRGVATGANEFFFMTYEQVQKTGIPAHYFVRAIGRTRDIPTEEVSQETLNFLQAKGRPTFLLALNSAAPVENYPEELKQYLKAGEILGLPQRPLISQRTPWYKMESRIAPPFLFAYLGRRNVRFIRNTAKIIPLTSFLCVYPKKNDNEYLEHLWKILTHPDTIANLAIVGKSYGDGAVKVEPRSLEKLPIPNNVIECFGTPKQMCWFED